MMRKNTTTLITRKIWQKHKDKEESKEAKEIRIKKFRQKLRLLSSRTTVASAELLREFRREDFHLIKTLLTNYIIREGKKIMAEKMVQNVLYGIRVFLKENDKVKQSELQNSVEKYVVRVVKRVRPLLFLRKIHRGRTLKFIPLPLYPRKQVARAVKQIVIAARKRRTEFGMVKKLLGEFLDLGDLNKKPESIKAKETLYELAVENKKNSRMISFLRTPTF